MSITRVVRSAIGAMAIAITGMGAGCGGRDVQTDLEPEGPPVVKQVLLQARVQLEAGARTLTQLTYGSHPDLNDTTSVDDYTTIDTGQPAAAALARTNRLRIVFDELLVGNNMEEMACMDGSYSRVPRGTTPDDIAKCAGDADELAGCTGDHVVCVGTSGPIGILDCDQDGAVDADSPPNCDFNDQSVEPIPGLRMLPGVVTITCDGTEVVWDPLQSFYQPSGNQLISAGPLGVDSLGPALVIMPANPDDPIMSGMRTGAACSIDFADDIIDKDDIQVCAPAEGGDCVPGDTTGITWTVEPLRIAGQSPTANQTGVNLGNPNSNVLLQFNAAVDDTTIAGITIADESGLIPDCAEPPVGQCVQRTRSTADPTLITVTVVGGYTPANEHTVVVPTAVTDVFGGPMPSEYSFTFTTDPATPTPDAGIDAEPADAGIDAA